MQRHCSHKLLIPIIFTCHTVFACHCSHCAHIVQKSRTWCPLVESVAGPCFQAIPSPMAASTSTHGCKRDSFTPSRLSAIHIQRNWDCYNGENIKQCPRRNIVCWIMTLVVINILLLILASALNDLHAVNADSGFPTEGDSCTTGKDLWEKGLSGYIVHVIDGDTVKLQLHSIPPVFSRISCRIFGIDAPELRRSKCCAERCLAELARNLVASLHPKGSPVELVNPRQGKYFRFFLNLSSVAGDTSAVLLRHGLAVPYDGTGTRFPWCKPPRRHKHTN